MSSAARRCGCSRAVSYALLPAATGAVAAGRLGTAALLVLLPPLLRVAVLVPGSWRAAWGGSLLLAVVVAFAPVVWPVAAVCGATAVLLVDRRWTSAARTAAFLLAPLLLLAPWSGYVATHPALLLLEPGLPGPVDPALRPVHVLLLHPGGPGMTPVWFSLGILLAALAALLRGATRTRVVAAWALALVGLVAGVVATVVTVVPPTGTTAAHPWPGPATVLVGAGLLLAAAVGADGALRQLSGASFSWRQPAAAVTLALVVLGPVLAGLGWVLGGVPGPITRGDPAVVPAYVADDSRGPQRPRTLLLALGRDGSVQYTLVTGDGPRLGDAETGPAGSAYDSLDGVVGDLVAGRGGTEVTVLGTYAVRYVVLSPPADPRLVRVLDTEPGLRRISGGEGETLWRLDAPSSRVRIEGPETAVTPVPVVVDSPVTEVDTDVAAATGQRRLVIAESDDAGWRAALDGTPLTPGEGSWAATFALPQDAGRLTASFDDGPRSRWLWWQLLVLVVVVVLALPGPAPPRRRPGHRRARRDARPPAGGVPAASPESSDDRGTPTAAGRRRARTHGWRSPTSPTPIPTTRRSRMRRSRTRRSTTRRSRTRRSRTRRVRTPTAAPAEGGGLDERAHRHGPGPASRLGRPRRAVSQAVRAGCSRPSAPPRWSCWRGRWPLPTTPPRRHRRRRPSRWPRPPGSAPTRSR